MASLDKVNFILVGEAFSSSCTRSDIYCTVVFYRSQLYNVNAIQTEERIAMETSVMHGKAVASLVLGICAIVCWFFGVGALVGIILGIIGLVLAGQAKKAGNTEGIRTGGFVCSLIGLIGSGIAVIIAISALALAGSIFDKATLYGSCRLDI